MAIFFLAVKAISRSTGQSAPAAAAYRAGSLHGAPIVNHRDGLAHDYRRRRGVEAALILAPSGCNWALEREDLWNRAEAAEKRKDAKTAREYIVALPDGLNAEQRRELAVSLGSTLVARYGIAIDLAVHEPSARGDQRNFHAHLLATTRTVGPDGLGPKTKVLDSPKTSGPEVEWIRSIWGRLVNEGLERCGAIERVSHLSYARQGTDKLPQRHLGPAATAMERSGRPSYLGDRNRAVAEINALIEAERVEEVRLNVEAKDRALEDSTVEQKEASRLARIAEEQQEAEHVRRIEIELRLRLALTGEADSVASTVDLCCNNGARRQETAAPSSLMRQLVSAEVDLVISTDRKGDQTISRVDVSAIVDWLCVQPTEQQEKLLALAERAGPASRQEHEISTLSERLRTVLTGRSDSTVTDVELCWNTGARSEETKPSKLLFRFLDDPDLNRAIPFDRNGEAVVYQLSIPAVTAWLVTRPAIERDKILQLAERAAAVSRSEIAHRLEAERRRAPLDAPLATMRPVTPDLRVHPLQKVDAVQPRAGESPSIRCPPPSAASAPVEKPIAPAPARAPAASVPHDRAIRPEQVHAQIVKGQAAAVRNNEILLAAVRVASHRTQGAAKAAPNGRQSSRVSATNQIPNTSPSEMKTISGQSPNVSVPISPNGASHHYPAIRDPGASRLSEGARQIEREVREALAVGPDEKVWALVTPYHCQTPTADESVVGSIVELFRKEGVKYTYQYIDLLDDRSSSLIRRWHRAQYQTSDIIAMFCRLGDAGNALIARLAEVAKISVSYLARVAVLMEADATRRKAPEQPREAKGASVPNAAHTGAVEPKIIPIPESQRRDRPLLERIGPKPVIKVSFPSLPSRSAEERRGGIITTVSDPKQGAIEVTRESPRLPTGEMVVRNRIEVDERQKKRRRVIVVRDNSHER